MSYRRNEVLPGNNIESAWILFLITFPFVFLFVLPILVIVLNTSLEDFTQSYIYLLSETLTGCSSNIISGGGGCLFFPFFPAVLGVILAALLSFSLFKFAPASIKPLIVLMRNCISLVILGLIISICIYFINLASIKYHWK